MLGQRTRRRRQDRGQGIARRAAIEGTLGGEHLVDHAAEREDVARRSGGLAADLLGRHVADRSQECPRAGHHRRRLGLVAEADDLRARQAEVEHLDVAGRLEENVGGLDVAMHDVVRVRRGEPAGDADRDAQRVVQRQRPVATDPLGEVLALEQLGHREADLALAREVVDGEDVWVRDPGQGLGLALESLERLGIVRHRFRQHLHRHPAVEMAVAGDVDLSHAARTEGFEDLEVSEDASGLQHGMGSDSTPCAVQCDLCGDGEAGAVAPAVEGRSELGVARPSGSSRPFESLGDRSFIARESASVRARWRSPRPRALLWRST